MINTPLIIAIAAMLLTSIFQMWRIDSMRNELQLCKESKAITVKLASLQNAAVDDLKRASDKQKIKINLAQQESSKEIYAAQRDSVNIMSNNVPSDCVKAARWAAIESAKIIGE